MNYYEAITEAMTWLGQQSNTKFMGQAVAYPGTFMYGTLSGVSMEKRLELPVCESLQMQITTGMGIEGTYVPVSIFPRQNFLLLATADMVNMLDKVKAISHGALNPHVIIRTASGPDSPIHPGHQHVGDYFEAFRRMFGCISTHRVDLPEHAMEVYQYAYNTPGPHLIIENGRSYSG